MQAAYLREKVTIVAYDLPIAVGILIMATEQVAAVDADHLFLGELSLDGSLRHTTGILPMVSVARDRGTRVVFVPSIDAPEAAIADGMEVIPISTLAELVEHRGRNRLVCQNMDLDMIKLQQT